MHNSAGTSCLLPLSCHGTCRQTGLCPLEKPLCTHEGHICARHLDPHTYMHSMRLCDRIYFSKTFRRMPTANAEGLTGSEGSIGKVSARRAFTYLQTDTGPRRSPSACSEKLLKIDGTDEEPPPKAEAVVEVRGKYKKAARRAKQLAEKLNVMEACHLPRP